LLCTGWFQEPRIRA